MIALDRNDGSRADSAASATEPERQPSELEERGKK
jgi:hypothetical protein